MRSLDRVPKGRHNICYQVPLTGCHPERRAPILKRCHPELSVSQQYRETAKPKDLLLLFLATTGCPILSPLLAKGGRHSTTTLSSRANLSEAKGSRGTCFSSYRNDLGSLLKRGVGLSGEGVSLAVHAAGLFSPPKGRPVAITLASIGPSDSSPPP